jgi:transposase
LLFQHGLICADDKKKVSPKWIRSLQLLQLTSGLRFALDQYIAMWLHMDEKIKEIDKEMVAQAQKDSSLENIYRSAPGIGPTSARILANELESTSQFNNERQLFSYVGLTPSEYSSGEHVRQGHITRQGKPILRKILVQAAWVAIRLDTALLEIYKRLEARVGGKKAIIGIARRLIGRIRACFRTGKLYSIGRNENEKNREDEVYELEKLELITMSC